MDAVNAPVRHAPREVHTSDIKIQQKPVIHNPEDRIGEVVVAPEDVNKDYMEALAFAEEPVEIRVSRSGQKNAPHCIDVWCNGKGAEVLMNGKWVETRAIPVGIPVITKRKYVEILARSKTDTIDTQVEKREDTEINAVHRNTSANAPLSIIHDANPKGVEWFTNLIRYL